MPSKRCPGGWCWGSKGPFPTKAKADEVGRTAYAHGYKGKSKCKKKRK
jgi:hypothetical protein